MLSLNENVSRSPRTVAIGLHLLFALGILIALFGVGIDYVLPGTSPGVNLPQLLVIAAGLALSLGAHQLRREEVRRKLSGERGRSSAMRFGDRSDYAYRSGNSNVGLRHVDVFPKRDPGCRKISALRLGAHATSSVAASILTPRRCGL